ncbi:MAG TPA: hypothetical protein VKA63_04690 [Candidatus Krumholzibacteria bacterium]|nr:hypothetical protein [Candidatus Krumholzibacteria bacterium]
MIAALGVVLSLVFVGFEVQQNTRALQATVRNDLATVMTSTMALIRNIENVFLQARLGTVGADVVGSFGMRAPIVDPGFAEAFGAANGY